MAIEKEQDAGHAPGQGEQGTVGGLIAVEGGACVVCLGEGVGEEERLAEGEGEAFSGDGVDGARGVAGEGDAAEGGAGVGDAGEAAGESEATAFGGERLGATQEAAEGGERVEDVGRRACGLRVIAEMRVRRTRYGGRWG